MKTDMGKYDSKSVGSYEAVPAGIYLVRIEDAQVAQTKNGDEMWKLTMKIVDNEGGFFGRLLFDNVVFSGKAMARAKLILESFGVDVSEGEREYQPEMLVDSIAKVQVSHTKNYTTATGEERKQSVIDYAGYFPADSQPQRSEKPKAEDDDIPF